MISGRQYCPICGRLDYPPPNHRCPPRTLSAIEAANTRAIRAEDDPVDPFWRTWAYRLAEGSVLLGERKYPNCPWHLLYPPNNPPRLKPRPLTEPQFCSLPPVDYGAPLRPGGGGLSKP